MFIIIIVSSSIIMIIIIASCFLKSFFQVTQASIWKLLLLILFYFNFHSNEPRPYKEFSSWTHFGSEGFCKIDNGLQLQAARRLN